MKEKDTDLPSSLNFIRREKKKERDMYFYSLFQPSRTIQYYFYRTTTIINSSNTIEYK